MDPKEIVFNLNDDNPEQIKTLREIITLSCCDSQNWKPLASKLEDLIKQNQLIGKESALLASQALFCLYTNFDNDNISNHLLRMISSQESDETCKLTVAFGYLQIKTVPPIPDDIFKLLFGIIKPHCMTYTKHTYFAEKVLYQWLLASSKTQFWTQRCGMKRSLEDIIFSNWQNSIQGVAKCNSSRVFSLYLKIMQDEKIRGSPPSFEVLYDCTMKVSWNHVIKYKILTEVYQLYSDGQRFADNILNYTMDKLLEAVMVCHLQKASSHVFVILLTKKIIPFNMFVGFLEERVQQWGEENNDEAVFFVYEYIIKRVFQLSGPSFRKFMIHQMSEQKNLLYNTYVQLLQYESKQFDIPLRRGETRVNVFKSDYQIAAHLSLLAKSNLPEHVVIKNVICLVTSLANTESIYLRKELIRNMNIVFNRVSKLPDHELKILYDFFCRCFSIASTYQRKILGLTVYRNAFQRGSDFVTFKITYMTNDKISDNKKEMRNRLFRLVLDPASDIRILATELLVNHFLDEPLTEPEIELLKEKAHERSNSLNFYEAETAAILIRLLYEWKAIEEDLDFWICEACEQLMEVKTDICKAVCNNKPFYGILIIILENFHGAFDIDMDIRTHIKILDLLENAVQFFTETLLKPVESSEYESTVAGIGVAVQEIVQDRNTESDLSISREHQNILTCIWRSLKATSEIAAEIAIKSEDDENIGRSCRIILNILLKCYHKGAIKSAGLSLARVCRHFCETNKITRRKNPFEEQMKSLCQLERSNDEEAGLTIAFHRIVASDVRPTRPFVHYAMETLLGYLTEKLKAMNVRSNEERALPCVLQLNFLQTLVEDKQLLSAITVYLEDVSFVALQFMQAKDFLIRNAGMQLYGAIIPRLTGQIADVNRDFGYGYSISHFVTHYPRLSEHVLHTLESCSRFAQTRTINLESYSNLSNIMILLSKLFVGACSMIDQPAEGYVSRVLTAAQNLFRCHVAYVRQLAAKVYVAFTATQLILNSLKKLLELLPSLNNENELHGFLLAYTYLKEKEPNLNMNSSIEPTKLLKLWSQRCQKLSQIKKPCFVVETLLLKNPEILYVLGNVKNIGSQCVTTEELSGLLLGEKFVSFAGFQEFVTELMKMYCENHRLFDPKFIEMILVSPNHYYATAYFEFVRVSDLPEYVDGLNRVIDVIIDRRIKNHGHKNLSMYDVLQPAVVKALAEFKLVERYWKYRRMTEWPWCPGIKFSEPDANHVTEDSVTMKLLPVFHKALFIGYDGYRNLPDFYRKLYAEFMYDAYKGSSQCVGVDLHLYILMISRDEVPEVRDTVKNVTDEFVVLGVEPNEFLFPRLEFEMMQNMEKLSDEEYWARCESLLQLVDRQIYKNCRDDNVVTSYHDDIQLLNFVNHLIVNRHDILSGTGILQCRFEDDKHFRSLRSAIDTPDSIYVLQVHDCVLNKLSQARMKKLG